MRYFRVGTLRADTLVSPMWLLGAVVSKTTSIGSDPVFGDIKFKGKEENEYHQDG